MAAREVHECYDKSAQCNVFRGYGHEGYVACMDYMNRNRSFDHEYFRTEREDFTWEDNNMLIPISIYKDTTGQYTDEECDIDNVVEIPVPQDLLFQWYVEDMVFDRTLCPEQEPEDGWSDYPYPILVHDMLRWVWEESICDETLSLYDWLKDHNYYWKRLD